MEKKKISKAKIAYLIFVLVLIIAIVLGLVWVKNECQYYDDHSAATLVEEERVKLSEELGKDLICDMIPSSDEEGNYVYLLKNDKTNIAQVTLNKISNGIFNLANFEVVEVKGVYSTELIIADGSTILINGDPYTVAGETYTIQGTEEIASYGFALPSYSKVKLDGLYSLEDVSVTKDGKELQLISLGEDLLFATTKITDTVSTTIKERVALLADKYSHFISNDITFWDFYSYFASGSPLYNRFVYLDVQWYNAHDYAIIKNLQVSDPVYLADRYVLVNASYDFEVLSYGSVNIDQSELSFILYLEDDGYWRMVDLLTATPYEINMTDQRSYTEPYSYPNGKLPYCIKVNRVMNCVTVYAQDENGDYTDPVKAFVCSTGREGHETPTGTYNIENFRPAFPGWCLMVDGSSGQFTSGWYGGYLFHSICYYYQDPSTMMVDEYNMLGEFASLGCVRLQTLDARWIYDNCAIGTTVIVYDDETSPGPLGKPSKEVENISEEMNNGWDPTDPRPANPWRYIL